MTTSLAIQALMTSAGFLALWIFVFYFWRDYRLDALRDDLFAIRDNLFLYAAKGNISFNHPAYQQLRFRINVLLRYAHKFTMAGLFFAMVTASKRSSEIAMWEELLETVPSDEAKAKLKEVQLAVSMTLLRHMVTRSFSLFLLSWILCLAGKAVEAKNRIMGLAKFIPAVESLESEVVDSDFDYRGTGQAAIVRA